jgi:flagellar hook-length control protein FliK
VQTITGSLLNTPAASSSETVGTVQSDPGRAFSAVYAREMQQSGVSDSSETQDQSRPDDQSVEEHPLDAALLADVWAILEEVAPLQEVAGPGGENLPDELTSQLVDTAFELGLLADELSSALVQKPIFDARSIDPAMFAAGLGTTPAGSGLAASHSGSTDVTQSLATRSLALSSLLAALPATTMAGGDVIGSVAGLPGSSLIGTTPGLPTSSQPISQAITDVLGRLRALLDAAGKSSPLDTGSTLSAQSTTASGAPLMFADLPVPLLAMSNIPSASQPAGQPRLTNGLDILQTLSSPPTTLTALPAGLAGQINALQSSGSLTASSIGTGLIQASEEVLSGNPADLIRSSLAQDKSLKALTIDPTFNDVVNVDALLDEGFKIQDLGTTIMRESNVLSASNGATLESLLRSAAPTETRQPDAATHSTAHSNADRTTLLAEQRPTVATARSDVWLRSTDELPDHILAHVGRMHAQSLRFNAAGFGDLVQRMTLSLHPEELGQVDVQLRSGEQMSLVFHAREGTTRDLLEQNIARLRQMFESQGISLGDISVATGGAGDRQTRDETSNGLFSQFAQSGKEPGQDRTSGPRASVASDRLIDTRA